ncbi:MAG: class I SAM-dependent methyltransferase [Candidatus Eremiobacteraeota bacterium]|nr:class I SAM-dependent methyltransferase [Candidatus Eremiobacteraeota bacterium]
MSQNTPNQGRRPPHPLAIALIERLNDRDDGPILEVGSGSGRNTRALQDAGFRVVTLDGPRSAPCAGALSTHALLHGTRSEITGVLKEVAARLKPRSPFLCTFGSIRDARFGIGRHIETQTFAPLDGDEAGVAHTFFDAPQLREIFESFWNVESLEEHSVDTIAGAWAHSMAPLSGSVHYFAMLHRR